MRLIARRRSTFAAAAACAALAISTAAGPAWGASRIGVLNLAALAGKLQELKAINEQVKADQQLLEASVQGHQEQLKSMQAKLDQLRPDTAQYDDQMRQIENKASDYQLDEARRKSEMTQTINKQTKSVFIRVQQIVSTVAARRGMDVVIVRPEVPIPADVSNIDPKQLDAILSRETVLYASPDIDLTDEVVTEMDAQYKASGAAAKPAK